MNGGQINLFAKEQKLEKENNDRTNHYGLEINSKIDFKDRHLLSGEMQHMNIVENNE